jgi:hypothetical protein
MFGDDVHYVVGYRYVNADGSTRPFKADLRGEARSRYRAGRHVVWRYGIGALRTTLPALARHEYHKRPDPSIVAVEVRVRIRKNHRGLRPVEVFRFPPTGAR